MSRIEKDGHVWPNGLPEEPCIFCGRRLRHYQECNQLLSEWEPLAPLSTIATMLCSRMFVKVSEYESDYIAPVGWGVYHRRQHPRKMEYKEIPEQAYSLISYGGKPFVKEYHNDSLIDYDKALKVK